MWMYPYVLAWIEASHGWKIVRVISECFLDKCRYELKGNTILSLTVWTKKVIFILLGVFKALCVFLIDFSPSVPSSRSLLQAVLACLNHLKGEWIEG